MLTQQGLTMLALAASLLSMVLSMVALWPQWKDQMAVVRDVVLWAALAIVGVGLVHMGWRRAAISQTAQPAAAEAGGYQDSTFAQKIPASRFSAWNQSSDYTSEYLQPASFRRTN